MTSHAAVAAAIRQRLLEGRPAPLRGLGTLVRQHVPSRVEERPDGTRVLLPPGETIGLAAGARADESLAPAFARFRGLADADAERAYGEAMDQIEARLAATGEVRLPGVGLLRRTSGGVVLGVEADLLQAVNRTYEGLAPVTTGPAAPAPSPAPDRPPPPLFGAVTPPPSGPPPVEVVPPSESDVPTTPPPGAAPSAAAFDDGDAAPPPPEPPPAPDAPLRGFGMDDSFDDDLLDEMVSDARPAPFGPPDAAPLADTFAPTPEAHQPPPEAPPSTPASAVDDWADEAWTAPAFDEADRAADPFGRVPPTFEDADYDLVPPTPSRPPEPEPEAPPEPLADEPDLVLAPSIGPEAGIEVEGPPSEAPDVPAPPRAASASSHKPAPPPPAVAALAEDPTEPLPETPDEGTRSSGGWLWVLFIVLLLATVAAAVWFWPQIQRQLWPRLDAPPTEQAAPDGEETLTADAADASAPGAPTEAPDSLATASNALPVSARGGRPGPPADGAPAATVPATTAPSSPDAGPPDAGPPDAQASGRRLGVAPPADEALTPPVLAGLGPADRAALSGRASVDPTAAAWTLVVLSTPSRAEAEALLVRYRQAGYRAAVLETQAGGRAMFRVAVGQFASRDDAIRLLDRLPPQAPGDTWALDLQTL